MEYNGSYRPQSQLDKWQERHDDNKEWMIMWDRLFKIFQIVGWGVFIYCLMSERSVLPAFFFFLASLVFVGLSSHRAYKDVKLHEERREGGF